ncbi:MAG: peptidoglycan-associated lipoprotein Pal [Gammaproteobacteria bacterium]|jgi:peptidoglycan-associated lipoprotein
MRLKILSLLSALLLLGACATDAEDTEGQTGTGASAGAGSTSGSSAVAVEPGTIQDFIVNVGDRVFFDFDKSTLTGKAQETLNKQAAWLSRVPTATVLIEGHCDERGTREYNLALGERRATAVKDYLISKGVSASRIKTISYGKERPAVLGSNEWAWSQNRRGVTTITGGAES